MGLHFTSVVALVWQLVLNMQPPNPALDVQRSRSSSFSNLSPHVIPIPAKLIVSPAKDLAWRFRVERQETHVLAFLSMDPVEDAHVFVAQINQLRKTTRSKSK